MWRQVRRGVRRGLEVTGLIGPYYRHLERRLAKATVQLVDDGRPMPPPELITLVSGAAGQVWFSEQGQADAAKFKALAKAHGCDITNGLDVLDFGCGSGRIARWMAPMVIDAGGGFWGCDLNARSVAWCAEHLSGGYFVNGLRPPLDLSAGAVDLAYAHSVLTHLTEPTAVAWLAELRRVLRPGGLAILTFHDEDFADRWGTPEVSARLAREPYVVWNKALEGSNYLSAWTTRAHFTALASTKFEVLQIIPGGAEAPEQAIAVLRPLV